jgi:dipeptidyl aminopeptidase/acylaminoacyl peptidase
VRAVAAFNPALDFVSFGEQGPDNAQSAVARFLGSPYMGREELWAKASPLTYVSKQSAAFLFLHGTGDKTVPYQQSVDMMNKLKAAGVHAEMFTAEGDGHGFFNRPPWYEPTLKRMEEFFEKTLR